MAAIGTHKKQRQKSSPGDVNDWVPGPTISEQEPGNPKRPGRCTQPVALLWFRAVDSAESWASKCFAATLGVPVGGHGHPVVTVILLLFV